MRLPTAFTLLLSISTLSTALSTINIKNVVPVMQLRPPLNRRSLPTPRGAKQIILSRRRGQPLPINPNWRVPRVVLPDGVTTSTKVAYERTGAGPVKPMPVFGPMPEAVVACTTVGVMEGLAPSPRPAPAVVGAPKPEQTHA